MAHEGAVMRLYSHHGKRAKGIYLAELSNGAVKVGRSDQLAQRLTGLHNHHAHEGVFLKRTDSWHGVPHLSSTASTL